MSRLLRRADTRLERALGARPGLAAALTRYGLVVFVLLGVLFVAAGAAVPDGRGQQIIYASTDGGIYAIAPEGGERTTVYGPDDGAFAAAPLLNGGSRSLSFTVFRGEGEAFRGDLYGSDLVRGTNALIKTADPGEAFVYGGYSYDRTWLMAERFLREGPPNVAVLAASGASLRYIEPEGEGGSGILGASWTAQNSLYAWLDGGGSTASLTAYNFFERRQAVVYQTENRVGRVSYNFDSNTAVFDERPVGTGPEESRLTALAGTAEMPVSGADGLGLYDPSLPVPNLDRRMAVLWTDGETTGVGLFDPATWSFEKTPVTLRAGSRYPQVSYDGVYVATTSGTEIVVRRLESGEVVSRIPDVQSPQAAADMMRGAGLDAPQAVEWAAPPSYSWRSFADS